MKLNFKGVILYLVLSIIPLLFIGTSALISHSVDSEYREVITDLLKKDNETQMTYEMYDGIKYLSVETVCEVFKMHVATDVYNDTCVKSLDLKRSLRTYSSYAWLLISLGFVTYVLNLLLGWFSKLHRFVLLGAFKIGTILTFITTPILVLGQCAFGMGIIYYLGAYYAGRIPVGLMYSIALAGGVASLVLLYNMFKMLNKKLVVRGLVVTKKEQPKLWKIVEDVTKTMNTKLPDNLIVYFGDNYFVTQAPVVCFSGLVTGRTLVISLPCLYKFTESEFKAILVHEFSHFQGLDTLYSMYFYNSWGRLSDAYTTVSNKEDIASVCTMWLLISFMQCFIGPKAHFDRLREKRADLNAARLISNESMGGALVKLTLYSLCWNAVEKEKSNARTEGKYLINESKTFNIFCDNLTKNKDKKDIINGYLNAETNIKTDALDDHPCLKDRLEYLNIEYKKVNDFLKTTKFVPVINIFNNLSKLEEELSKYDAM